MTVIARPSDAVCTMQTPEGMDVNLLFALLGLNLCQIFFSTFAARLFLDALRARGGSSTHFGYPLGSFMGALTQTKKHPFE